MQERNQPAGCATPWTGVEQLEAKLGEVVEAGLNVLDAVGHVMEAASPLGQKPRDLRIRPGAAEQFDARLADLEHDRLDAVGGDDLPVRRGRAGEALICRNR